jgi:hypothetical protein
MNEAMRLELRAKARARAKAPERFKFAVVHGNSHTSLCTFKRKAGAKAEDSKEYAATADKLGIPGGTARRVHEERRRATENTKKRAKDGHWPWYHAEEENLGMCGEVNIIDQDGYELVSRRSAHLRPAIYVVDVDSSRRPHTK